jgi:hypothetical protein
MKGLKTVRFGLAGTLAAALIAVGAFLLVSQASAVSGTLNVSSATIAPGGQGSVELTANVPLPGLGAWTVDITYDSTKVTVVSCAPAQGGVCNPHFGANVVRITGAHASAPPDPPGIVGDTSLGTITFHETAATASACGTPAALTATTNVFSDGTIGAPAPITLTITSGTLTCAAAPTAVPPAPTATTGPGLGGTGTGPSSSDSSNWLIVALAGAGLAALAGYGALRLRSKAA